MTKKRISSLIVAVLSVAMSGCVTQEFTHNKTPVVKNQANRNDMAATRISLGLGYLKISNMAQAKQNLEKAKNFAPDMVQVYTAFAHYYETVGENELTIKSFEKALSLKSDDADTLNNYGVYLCRQDQIAAAEKQFLKAIAVPSYILVAKSYDNLSACFLQKNNFVKAELYLHKAIMHSPSSSSILFQMVRLQYAMGEFSQAKTFEQRFEKVTRRFTPQSLALAYKVYWKLGQRRTAKKYGTMLVKMYPQSWEAQQYLLNELEQIEADNLAKRYKLTQLSETPTKSKKRVVKLSPKKASSKKALASKAVNNSRLVESNVGTEKVIYAAAIPTLSTINTAVTSSMSAANPALINAALTMASVKAITSVFDQKQAAVTPVSAPNVSVNTREKIKRVVVLTVAKTARNELTKADEIVLAE
ncbi:MAG: type IV pilus biogenesis/stability protein PilW [Colwellia sp.]|nr:type IV pilus biogenesis/stability protein PilW [Colwellia sp.]